MIRQSTPITTLTALLLALPCLLLVPQPATADTKVQAPDPAKILALMPGNPPIAIVVPRVGEAAQKVAMLNQTLGINHPNFTQPLETLQHLTGIQGLNPKGAAAIVITRIQGETNNKAASDADGAPALLLVPVSDYNALITGLGGKTGADIADVRLFGEPAFARRLEGHALIGPARQLVASYTPATATPHPLANLLGETASQRLARNDLSILLNIQAIGQVLRPIMRDKLNEQQQIMQMTMGNADPDQFARNIAAMTGDAIDAFFRDTAGMVIGIDVQQQGIAFDTTLRFRPGSRLAKMCQGGGDATSVLNRMPDRPYVAASALSLKGIDLETLIDDILGAWPEDQRSNAFYQLLRPELKALRNVRATAQVIYSPSSQLAAFTYPSVSVMEMPDAEAYLKDFEISVRRLGALKLDLGLGEGMNLTFNTSFERDVTKVNGVAVHAFEQTPVLPETFRAQMGPLGNIMPRMMNYQGYIAVTGDHVVITNIRDENLLGDVFNSLDKSAGLANQRFIRRVRELNGLENTTMEAYVNLSDVLQQASMLLGLFGMPAIQVPANLPPVGMAVAVDRGTVQMRAYLPMPVVRFVSSTVIQLQRQHMQGSQDSEQPEPGNGNGNGVPPAPTH